MDKMLKLFSILQLTKEQPLTGYLAAGIKLSETCTLSGHHYTCALMGYFICQKIKANGGQIDEKKVVSTLLIHDLGELFGGDISGPLNRKYPELSTHKDAIGEKAVAMLADFMDEQTKTEFLALQQEFEKGNTDEKWVAKIIDQIEHQFFLEQQNCHYQARDVFMQNHIYNLVDNLQDNKTKEVLTSFLEKFKNNLYNQGFQAYNFLMAAE